MLGIFSSLKSFASFSQVCIDSGFFVLHYKATVLILLVCTMIISCKQHVGEPIVCLADNNDVKFARAVDSYCYIFGSYTVNELMDGKQGLSRPTIRPGVGQHTTSTTSKVHKYYQWVGFFLLFQASTFYFPRFLWKLWEGGKMKNLTLNLKNDMINSKEKQVVLKRKAVSNYFLRNFNHQNNYAVRYFLCEVANLLNVFGQIVLTDVFLGYEFSKYGIDVLNFVYSENAAQLQRTDPMDKIFPKLSKCTFSQFGPSGNIVGYDVLCVLPLNILNEKVFVFLWFWFILLALFSLFGILYRISTIIFVPMRRYRLESKASLCEPIELKIISRYSYFGDWFILIQLSKNMDPLIYADLLKDIALKLKKNGTNGMRFSEKLFSRQDTESTLEHEENANNSYYNSEPLYDCVPNEIHLA